VLSLYEDFLCPVCGRFEQQFGVAVNQLVNSGAIAADYYMDAILDRPQNQNYSSRAGGAAYCVADDDTTPTNKRFSDSTLRCTVDSPANQAQRSRPTRS
jgi:protein-disulfide isomerase